ncbi:MAG: acyl-CoA thioesterase [Myxococcales bacterium]
MPLPGKPPRESRVEMTELVLPSDANHLGTVFGGKVMQWIDICGAIACGRHCRKPVVTASMDDLHFYAPIHVGEVAVLEGRVLASFHTSMECAVSVYSENPLTGERRLCTSALLTFVALDKDGNRVEVPPVLPESEYERHQFEEANERRRERLARKKAKPKAL